MSSSKELEESFREAACNGNEELLNKLLHSGVDCNTQNAVNGWTALHWAAKRGHVSIASFLLQNGANKNLTNNNHECPIDVASSKEMIVCLGGNPQDFHPVEGNSVSFVPSYLSHPPFPYGSDGHHGTTASSRPSQEQGTSVLSSSSVNQSEQELVLKVRLANASEKDFIEIELPCHNLTFENLFSTMCQELQVQRALVIKIRKLPDTIVRKDKDVQRLGNMQELEMVLSNRYISESSRNYKPAVAPRNESIVY